MRAGGGAALVWGVAHVLVHNLEGIYALALPSVGPLALEMLSIAPINKHLFISNPIFLLL